MTERRCRATLEHLHGVTRCERDPLHGDDQSSRLEEHVGTCPGCLDDDEPYTDLHWTGYREKW